MQLPVFFLPTPSPQIHATIWMLLQSLAGWRDRNWCRHGILVDCCFIFHALVACKVLPKKCHNNKICDGHHVHCKVLLSQLRVDINACPCPAPCRNPPHHKGGSLLILLLSLFFFLLNYVSTLVIIFPCRKTLTLPRSPQRLIVVFLFLIICDSPHNCEDTVPPSNQPPPWQIHGMIWMLLRRHNRNWRRHATLVDCSFMFYFSDRTQKRLRWR